MYVLENRQTSCLVYLRRGSYAVRDRVEQDSYEVGLESQSTMMYILYSFFSD